MTRARKIAVIKRASAAVPLKFVPSVVVNCTAVVLFALRILKASLVSKLTDLPESEARVRPSSPKPAVKVICRGAFCTSLSSFEQLLSASIPATAIKMYFFIVFFRFKGLILVP